ncbi:conserved hypothetical protein [delta proteobacterium NaphS2]|nr:conserved hypothetical protein [delta proteobacterium NaphS2]
MKFIRFRIQCRDNLRRGNTERKGMLYSWLQSLFHVVPPGT